MPWVPFGSRQVLLTAKKRKKPHSKKRNTKPKKATPRKSYKTKKITKTLKNFFKKFSQKPKQKKRSKPKRIKKKKVLIKKKKIARKPKKSVKKIKKLSSRKLKVKKEIQIGKVTHFFPNVSAAVIELKKPLKIGDSLHIKGPLVDFSLKVTSMQINNKPIEKAKKGDEVGLLVKKQVRNGDLVYKK